MPTSLPSRVLFGAWLLVAGASLSLADEPQFDRPELVAIAWPSERVGPDAATAVAEGLSAWRPDGTPLPPEELVTLKKELRAFGSLGKPEPDRLVPLHLLFRIDSRARNSQRLASTLAIDNRRLESIVAQEGSSAGHLALSVLALSQKALAKWPAKINVEIRVPIDEGDVIQSIREVSDAPREVAPGARMFWTQTSGPDPAARKLFPAVALEIDRRQTALLDYDFFTHLKDGTTESFNARQATTTHDLCISQPLATKDAVDHVDLWRLRYRPEQYLRLPTFPERIPR